jgi:hypothetical protein
VISGKRRCVDEKQENCFSSAVACSFCCIMGAFLLTAQAADTATATDENALNTAATNTVAGDSSNALGVGFGGMGFGGRHRGGPMGMFGGFGVIEVSEEFEQKSNRHCKG